MARLGHALLATCVVALVGCDDPLVHQDDEHTREIYTAKVQQWTQWALRLPWAEGPILDQDGSECGLEQSGKTWLLAGTSGGPAERACTIPRNRHLFFPLINYWVAPPATRVDTPEELEEVIAFIATYFPARRARTCSLTLRIDGEDLLPDLETMDEELFAQQLELFEVTLGEDNFIGDPAAAGVRPATAAAGHWALLRPLPPGDHVLEFGGALCYDDGEIQFETAATYALHVED